MSNMEEKELDLVRLLDGWCNEGEHFYSPLLGECEYVEYIEEINMMRFRPVKSNHDGLIQDILCDRQGRAFAGGECIIWPSKDYYHGYYLNGRRPQYVWDHWNKTKDRWWRAYGLEPYWVFDSYGGVSLGGDPRREWEEKMYLFGNHFKTKALAQEAAEEVHKCLEEFHKTHRAI